MGSLVMAVGFPLGQDTIKISRGVVAGWENRADVVSLGSGGGSMEVVGAHHPKLRAKCANEAGQS